MKQKALRAGDAHSHEDEECRKRSTLRFGRCLTSATGAQQRARLENVPRHILSYLMLSVKPIQIYDFLYLKMIIKYFMIKAGKAKSQKRSNLGKQSKQ